MNVPAVQTDPMAEFRNKLGERVRNDIRELLPEDAVAALVQEAVKEVFFKPVPVEPKHWQDRTTQKPSWFVEAVTEAARPIIKAEAEKFIAANHAEVEKVIAAFLDTNKLTVATSERLTMMLCSMINDLQNTLRRN